MPEETPPPPGTPEEERLLTEVGRFRKLKKAHDYGLALLAADIPYWVFQHDGRYHLLARTEQVERAMVELEKYHRQARNWPPRPFALVWKKESALPTAFYALILVSFYILTKRVSPELEERGMLSAQSVVGGREWWRVVTALTLHADIGHLTANLGFGCYFGYLATRYLGGGAGWLLILLSGALGNLANALFYYPYDHRSLGASTAIFGALGLLAGFPLGRAQGLRSFWEARKMLVPPLVGSVMLLILLGFGELPTDIMAHVWGFLAGLLLGAAAGKIKGLDQLGRPWQLALSIVALLIIFNAWLAALP